MDAISYSDTGGLITRPDSRGVVGNNENNYWPSDGVVTGGGGSFGGMSGRDGGGYVGGGDGGMPGVWMPERPPSSGRPTSSGQPPSSTRYNTAQQKTI